MNPAIGNALLLTSWTLLAGSALRCQADERLRWTSKAGERFAVVIDQQTRSMIETPAGEKDMSSHLITTRTWEVIESDEGKLRIRQTIDRVQMRQTIPFAGELRFDSDDPDADPGVPRQLLRNFQSAVGASHTFTIDRRGRRTDDEQGARYALLNEMMMIHEQLADQLFFELPEDVARPGDSWTQQFQAVLPEDSGFARSENNYTFAGVDSASDPALHEIKISGLVSFEMDKQEVVSKLDKGKLEGSFFFDASAGFLTRASLTQKMVIQMVAPAQTISQAATSSVSITIQRVDP